MMFRHIQRIRTPLRLRRSHLIFLVIVTVLVGTLTPKCEAIADPGPEPVKKSDPKSNNDMLTNEELHKLLGMWDNDSVAAGSNMNPVTALPPSTPPPNRSSSFFPNEIHPTTPEPSRSGSSDNQEAQSSAELLQSLNLLNALLGNPNDNGDVAATAALLQAAATHATTTPSPTITAAPPVKTLEEPSPAHQSLALLNYLLGTGGTKTGTESAGNLAAAAALLGLTGADLKPAVRQVNPSDASAAMLTNLLLAQAGLGTKGKNNGFQNFQSFANTDTNLDTAAQTNQLSGLLGLLDTLGSLGSLGKPAQSQSPLAGLLNFGQQQPSARQPDLLAALLGQGQDQKKKQEQQLSQAKQQQATNNLLANLLGGTQSAQQQNQQNLWANLLGASSNSPLNLFSQPQTPSFLQSLGTIGSSAFSLVGNTLNGFSGTRQNGKPRVRGVDTRLGLGYRLGPNADAQVVWEIGPQIFTDPITNEVKPVVTEKPATLQKRFQFPQMSNRQYFQGAASQVVPRYRLSPHPAFTHPAQAKAGHNRPRPYYQAHAVPGPAPYVQQKFTTTPRAISSSEETTTEKVHIMLTAYERWLKNNEKNIQLPAPYMVKRILQYQVPSTSTLPIRNPLIRRRFPGPMQRQMHMVPRPTKIIHMAQGPPVFPKPQQQSEPQSLSPPNFPNTNQYSIQRVGKPAAKKSKSSEEIPEPQKMIRPPRANPWPAPPMSHNLNPWQNFVRESDESFNARNAGVVDPKSRQIEIQKERDEALGFLMPNRNLGSPENNRRIMEFISSENKRKIVDVAEWASDTIVNTIRDGITSMKSSENPVTRFFNGPATTISPTQGNGVGENMISSIFKHLKKEKQKPQIHFHEEDTVTNDPVVKIGGDLSYEHLIDSMTKKIKIKPKIKVESKKVLELIPTSGPVKEGTSDRPMDPPIEMFIDIDNGEVSVRKSIGSIDMNRPWIPTTSRPKSQEELDDEESAKIFQDVQDHLKASFEEFKFNQELQKATQIHKEKVKAGLDDSMGLITRYFDLMDATKRKRDVSASMAATTKSKPIKLGLGKSETEPKVELKCETKTPHCQENVKDIKDKR